MKWLWRKIKSIFKSKPDTDYDSRVPSDDYTPVDNHPTNFKLWIPFAENIHKTEGIKMRSRGEFRDGYPQGILWHWTAGWMLKKGFWWIRNPEKKLKAMARDYALRTAKGGVKNGYNFLVMDVFGNIYQSRTLDKWGYHGGKSYWKGLGYSVSKRLVGVEMLNPGKLTKKGDKFYTWYKFEIPSHLVRYVTKEEFGVEGYFCMLTPDQESSMKKLAQFMDSNSPYKESGQKVFNKEYNLGHHEVSPGRKTDPGGSLSIPMDEFRASL